ncbi:hypothetical protein NY2A_b642L [Paramecium bursaria Chlorella virus NY2A]|uniref:Uncharacterized protein b642L n=1 Tax=Paramecium bursaria Chlorella virus NY2A TaxID=46021 RepID=A7IXG7_PBCVN|nr:hypothetical protein NY2A_b642L [Paramecium bursaria Chlorella virus NY2A]ABT15041.1 hypothetical protein NY2A_b642L [Paramecium bursaria Chlorella virus NY2A]
MESLVSADELVRQTQPGHYAFVAQPKESAKTSGEQNSFDAYPSYESFCKRSFWFQPFLSPFRLVMHRRNSFDGIEEIESFLLV